MSERLRLDARTPGGLAQHELVADPRWKGLDEDDADQSDADDFSLYETTLALVDDVAEARASRKIARAAEAEAIKARQRADATERRLVATANALVESTNQLGRLAEILPRLSRQQLDVVRARIEIQSENEPITHHAVARRLGLHPAAVSRQWARILRKLAAERGAVSTPAA